MRTALFITAAAVVLSPLGAQAAPSAPEDRVLTFDYTGLTRLAIPGRASATLGGCSAETQSCAAFETVEGETSLLLSAADKAGVPVGLAVTIAGAPTRYFCGPGTLPLPGEMPVQVTVASASTPGCTAATQGTITATLSRH